MKLGTILEMITSLCEQGTEELEIQAAYMEAKVDNITRLVDRMESARDAEAQGLVNAHESFLKDVADLLGCQPEEPEILARLQRAKGCFSG